MYFASQSSAGFQLPASPLLFPALVPKTRPDPFGRGRAPGPAPWPPAAQGVAPSGAPATSSPFCRAAATNNRALAANGIQTLGGRCWRRPAMSSGSWERRPRAQRAATSPAAYTCDTRPRVPRATGRDGLGGSVYNESFRCCVRRRGGITTLEFCGRTTMPTRSASCKTSAPDPRRLPGQQKLNLAPLAEARRPLKSTTGCHGHKTLELSTLHPLGI
jgi:hypothetical protein